MPSVRVRSADMLYRMRRLSPETKRRVGSNESTGIEIIDEESVSWLSGNDMWHRLLRAWRSPTGRTQITSRGKFCKVQVRVEVVFGLSVPGGRVWGESNFIGPADCPQSLRATSAASGLLGRRWKWLALVPISIAFASYSYIFTIYCKIRAHVITSDFSRVYVSADTLTCLLSSNSLQAVQGCQGSICVGAAKSAEAFLNETISIC